MLTEPVRGSAVVAFRVLFGLLMAWEATRYLTNGWALTSYGPGFHFTYWPFDFVRPLPGRGMEFVFALMFVAALGVAAGLWYRVSAVILAVTTAYVFLIDQVNYLNHWYLIVLFSILLVVIPAHRRYSLDAWRTGEDRPLRRWALWLLRFQISVPYVFGGIAKLNGDWLTGRPLTQWLDARTDTPLVGWVFEIEGAGIVLAWGAMLLDLAVPWLMLGTRVARLPAFGIAIVFHLMNARLFSIGVFPAMMVASTTLLLPDDWPERLLAAVRRRRSIVVSGGVMTLFAYWFAEGRVPQALVFGLGVAVLVSEIGRDGVPAEPEPTETAVPAVTMRGAAMGLLALWVAVQVLVPLRHLVIEGDPSWTEEGHRFAWHMKLRDKEVESIVFEVYSPQAQATWWVAPEQYLTPRQARKMASHPDMLVQFARFLEEEFSDRLPGDLEVMAHAEVSLNGREPRLLVDPDTDLTSVPRPWWGHAEWILPRDGVSTGAESG